ncbi:hypothetical protein CC99x_007775 [Candidatus Berkiella cookevillensis]|uniref:Uncharacterized protein n=1 Tax=Candidatus Berkiella cookevillensis TaxID=437022 RepID=A0A0Q9YL16_9GAMM|nr:hypothetical protein [Candidatus Berkiella cookevillensis]MCS5708801.1 hypothetical protein [Candidatus Berkiella cookevillensis]
MSIEEFQGLSKVERLFYKERLEAVQQYWSARLNLESRKNFQSNTAFEAVRENRILSEHLNFVNGILIKRTDIERKNSNQFIQIKQEETFRLKSSLMEQLKVYDEANGKLSALQEKRKTIAKEYQILINKINAPPKRADDELTVLDISSAQEDAKSALKSGDIERATQSANNAKNIIEFLSKTGNVSKSYLIGQAEATAAIADKVVQAEIQAQEQNIASIVDKITQIKADADLLKHLSVSFDINDAIQSAEELCNQIQAQLLNNPLKISAVVIPDGQNIESRAQELLKPQRKARGGLIMGEGTSTSDSILARLSSGEFVIRASAVKRYGLGLLNQINQLQLPKFARGGLVPPRVPIMNNSIYSNNNSTATLTLNLVSHNYNIQTQNIDVVQALTKAVAREALKSGRRV